MSPSFATYPRLVQAWITYHARVFDLDPTLIAALIQVESAGDPWASRYEQHYRWLYKPEAFAREAGVTVATERCQQKHSWGVLQIMGAVARERGYRGPLTALTDPDLGIEYGCRQLVWLREVKGYAGDDLISAYNWGSAQRRKDGRYRNQAYVDKVHAAWENT